MVHGHGGSWAGAMMAPEGKDNAKGQACLGCKRNGLGKNPQLLAARALTSYGDTDADLLRW
jgi:hypothetical protein